MSNSKKQKAYFLIIILTINILVTLLFSTNNSWLFLRGDSNIYFLCGKAWMNGLLPYHDFTDSKEPFLWLIYGLGYLINKTSVYGVLIFEIIFNSFSSYFFYKCIRLFYKEKSINILAVIFSSIMLYYYGYHMETVSETFCMPFLIVSMYFTLKIIYNGAKDNEILYSAFIVGLSAAATFLIKYNMTIIIFLMCLFILIHLIANEQKKVIHIIFSFIAGFMLFIFPFILYFIYHGIFGDFINGYFIETLETIKNINGENIYYNSSSFIHNSITLLLLIITSIISTIVFGIRYDGLIKKVTPFALFIITLLLVMRNGIFPHYYEPLFIFLCFPFIILIDLIKRYKYNLYFIGMFLFVIFSVNMSIYYIKGRTFFKANINAEEYYKVYNEVEDILLKKYKPTFIMINGFWGCWGLKSNALPGCRNFSEQAGMTENMKKERYESIIERKPDFLIVQHMQKANVDYIKFIDNCGYKVIYKNYITDKNEVVVFTHLDF